MKKHLKFITLGLLVLSFGIFAIWQGFKGGALQTYNYSWGSKGGTVYKIQSKLKAWGYYDGAIDGVYQTKTSEAVKYFQSRNGLNPTGVADVTTQKALGIYQNTSTESSASSSSSSAGSTGSYSNDAYLMAKAITGEARGEPYLGQVAVGAVILNRTRDARFPKTIAGVIYQPGAFTAVSDGQINLPPDPSCLRAAQDALNGWDPTYGCVYYYNPATATSSWIWSRTVYYVIGKHRFAR